MLAVGLSAVFFLLWYTVINPAKKDANPPAAPAAQAVEATKSIEAAAPAVTESSAGKEASAALADPQARIPFVTSMLKNSLVEADVTNDGGVVTSWRVLDYRQTTDPKSPPIDLALSEQGIPAPLSLSLDSASLGIPERPRFEVVESSDSKVVLRWRSQKIELTKTISLKPDSYSADVSIDVQNRSSEPITIRPTLDWSGVNLPQKKKGGPFSFLTGQQVDIRQPVFFVDGKAHRPKDVQKLTKPQSSTGAVYWAGIESRYFLSAIIPRVQGDGLAAEYGNAGQPADAQAAQGLWAGVSLPPTAVPPGGGYKSGFSVYAGPKEMNLLKAMGVRLEEAIDYGWFTVIAIPILYLLQFFYGVVRNYGIAIILLTIFVKLLLHPVNVRSLKSMKAMQQLQPRLKELQKKYKDDKQRLNAETMQLFRAHKVNPMGGCLPMLLQLPIYIALYKVLWSSIELYHAPFFWFYQDLSAPDPYLITPILLGIFMVAQQLLTPSASADPAQKKMMMFMPIMFTGFMLFLPVGLVIYILVNTGMSVTQQWMYNKGIGFMDLIRGRLGAKPA